jgi:hypothetical protein
MRIGRLWMALVLFLVVAGFYWKLTLTKQFDWIWGYDLSNQVLPWFEEQARAWGKQGIPIWDPYVWGGQPLLGQMQPGAAYPLNWILFALPLHNGEIKWWELQWYFVAIRLMAVSFCYLLCRDMGRSRAASLLAGAVFGLGGYIGNTGWPQMVNGAVWLPAVFLFLLRAGRGKNVVANAALSGMFLGISFLSGHHQAPMFMALAAAGVWLYYMFRSRRMDWSYTRAAALSAAIALATGALQILPAYEYGRLAKRWVGAPEALTWNQPVPYSVHETYDLKGTDLLGIFFPKIQSTSDPFVGVAALALALLGVGVAWRDWRARVTAGVAMGALLFALGHSSIFHGLLYAVVPQLDKARVASAAIFIFQFGVALLAAYGVDQLGAEESSPWTRRAMWSVLAFGIATLAIFGAVFFWNNLKFPFPDAMMVTPFMALILAAVFYATRRGALRATQCAVLLVVMVLFELGSAESVMVPRSNAKLTADLDRMRSNQDIASYLRKQPGFYRAEFLGDTIPANWGALADVPMWGGDLASITLNMLSFDFWRFQSRELWGVAYTIASNPPPDGGEEVFAGVSGMKVYRHLEVFPRAWAVHELARVPDLPAGNRMIRDDLAGMHQRAYLLTAAPALESCNAGDAVAVRQYRMNRVTVDARLSCRGMVVLSDSYFPGWHAYVDGKSARIYEVNTAMRGVAVPAGVHSVVFQYRPGSAVWGGVLTVLGIAAALVLGLTASTEKRQPS